MNETGRRKDKLMKDREEEGLQQKETGGMSNREEGEGEKE